MRANDKYSVSIVAAEEAIRIELCRIRSAYITEKEYSCSKTQDMTELNSQKGI